MSNEDGTCECGWPCTASLDQEKILAQARVRAARGAAALDAARHDDWRGMIDPDRLDLDCTINCVLGQLYHEYGIGVFALYVGSDDGNRSDWAWAHGFAGVSYGEDQALQVAWLEIIGAI